MANSLNITGGNIFYDTGNEFYPIPDSIETDKGYRNLLSKYISASLKCESCSELNRDSLELLFVRPSFEKMVISLCDEKNRVTNLYYEDYSRLEEALPYLVINCTNQEVQYKITDVLLKDGSAVGLIALWDSCNIRKLSYYDVYRDSLVSTRAKYALGDLAIIAHNLGDKEECLRLLRIIKKINKSFWGFLRKEIRGNNKIAYYEYDSAFNEYLTTIKSYNQLTGAAYSEPLGGTSLNIGNRYGEMISYDRNGNIASLQRNGMLGDQSFGLIDDLTIEYNGNQLKKVTDLAEAQLAYDGASDFVDAAGSSTEYTYNSNGALTKDLNRGINSIEYDLLGNVQRINFSGNRSIQYVYSADGRRLRTIHSKQTTAQTLVKDSIDYVGNLTIKDGHPSQYLFDGGYASFSNDALSGWHYYIQDYMGNNRMVVNRNGSTEQVTHYYPYGGVIGGISTNDTLQPYKFEGKELDRTFGLDTYDVHARNYFAMLPMWDRADPMAEKNNNVTPYSYCNGNPVNLIDFNGCDTLNISYINNKWCFDSPIIAKGNDVFNVTIDGKTTAYTFSEGVYGDRVDALNLELNKDYTLGIYHISGVSLIGTGYYVTPGGAPSTKDKSGARIPEGTYPIVEGKGYNWKKAGVGGSVEERGIRFHYEVSKNHNPRYSTSGCFVLSYDYTPQKNGSVKYDRNESIYASRNFDILVGGSYTYINKNNEREATKFLNPITAKLVLKSRRQ